MPLRATRLFQAVLADAGLPATMHLHDLRHHAAAAVVAGLGATVAAPRLGHARTSMTVDVYAKPVMGQDREAADLLGNILYG